MTDALRRWRAKWGAAADMYDPYRDWPDEDRREREDDEHDPAKLRRHAGQTLRRCLAEFDAIQEDR